MISRKIRSSLEFSFTYGSGAFYQVNSVPGMLDCILVSKDSKETHRLLLKEYPEDYCWWSRIGGPSFCRWIQGSDVYYQPFVVRKDSTQVYKYGIIDKEDLMRDLHSWEKLHVAGRLHKPVGANMECGVELTEAIERNYDFAVNVACILLFRPEKSIYSFEEIYVQICSISYMGDVRFEYGAENPNKIRNIIGGQFEHFNTLYRDRILNHPWVSSCDENTFTIHPKQPLALPFSSKGGTVDDAQKIRQYIGDTIRSSSRNQAWKGFLSAGPYKTILYAWEKLKKGSKLFSYFS